MEPNVAAPEIPAHHFLSALNIAIEYGADGARGTAEIAPTWFAPGTTTVRTALLVTMHDFVSGYMSGGPSGPTLDIRLQLLRRPPTSGRIEVRARPLRIGGRLIVGDAVFLDERGYPFARGHSTFMRLDTSGRTDFGSVTPMPEASFDELLGAIVRDEHTLELTPTDRHHNLNDANSVQGGIYALLSEVSAEHAAGGGRRLTATDIDLRFLTVMRTPPLVAAAEVVGTSLGDAACRVRVSDSGQETRLVAYAALTMRAAE